MRIEDTDKKREVEGSKEKIQELLKLFGLAWDEFYVQSERVRTGVYQEAAQKLMAEGHAFYCQCEAKNAKESFSKELRDPCRDLKLTSGAVKLKVPENQNVNFHDFVLDRDISWNTSDVSDATLLKSDGFPTYHLAVVVDDTAMDISHVLRGHDWMPSTPIHLLVYKYLGYEIPQIGHLTDIQDPEGGKLSKRKGSTSCEGLLAEGYLPEAILNFIMLLGWAPKDNQEIFSLEKFVENFDPKGFQKTNPVFNREKLDWFNGYYLRQIEDGELINYLVKFAPEGADLNLIERIAPLVKDRMKKLSDFQSLAGFFFERPKPLKVTENYSNHLKKALAALESVTPWTKEELDNALMAVVEKEKFKTGDFFMDLRGTITGSKFTPPINDSIVILGKDETLGRLKEALG